MKNLHLVSLMAIAILFCKVTAAQVYLEPKIYPPTLGNSDGAVKVKLMGYSGAVDYLTYVGGTPVNTDTLYGIAYDDFFAFEAFEAGTSNLLASLTVTSLGKRVNELSFSNVINPASTNSCDGSVAAVHSYDNLQYSEADFSRDLIPGGFSGLGTPTNGVFEWGGLCVNDYGVIIRDVNTYDTIVFSSVSLDAMNSGGGSSTLVDVYASVSDVNSCTSNSIAFVNGVAPFLFSYDYGAFTSSSIINSVCPGMHTLHVIDGLGDTVGVNFGVVDSSFYYQGPFFPGFVDTIATTVQNCNFNYTQPVDSFVVSYFETIDSNTIYFESDIWQSGILTQVNDTVSTASVSSGLNYFALTIYCGTKANSQKIYQLSGYIESQLDVKEVKSDNNIVLSPNPSDGIFFINTKQFEAINVYNPMGELVLSTDNSWLDLSDQPTGVYFCNIQLVSEDVVTLKIIKN